MAGGFVLGANDLFGKLPQNIKVQGDLGLGRLLKVRFSGLPEQEILQRFQRAINRASVKITNDLKGALDSALRSSVWSVSDGTADIYDTGELLQSGNVKISGNTISIEYDAPYAGLVHYGGYINPYGNSSAKVYLPPRPWIESVLNGGGPVPQFDFESYYRAELEQEFR